MSTMTRRRKKRARHRREPWTVWLARRVCRVIGHDEERLHTGDIICWRCSAPLGRWRS